MTPSTTTAPAAALPSATACVRARDRHRLFVEPQVLLAPIATGGWMNEKYG